MTSEVGERKVFDLLVVGKRLESRVGFGWEKVGSWVKAIAYVETEEIT